MISIHINGVKIIPGIDYVATDNSVSFSQPPQFGDDILVSSPYGVVTKVLGDGSTFMFPLINMQKHNDVMNILNDASTYYENPTVADALEKLRVVLELVKK